MPAKPVRIGVRYFDRQKDALDFYKEILGRYEIGQRVSQQDEIELMALLGRHQDVASKIGGGVDHFKVDKDGYGGRCFWIVRMDSTETDFTYIRCVTGIW